MWSNTWPSTASVSSALTYISVGPLHDELTGHIPDQDVEVLERLNALDGGPILEPLDFIPRGRLVFPPLLLRIRIGSAWRRRIVGAQAIDKSPLHEALNHDTRFF